MSSSSQDRLRLRAGPVELLWDGGEVRYLKLGDREILRRVYGAVRDRNWRTLAGVISDVKMDVADDRFAIQFQMTHTNAEMSYSWEGSITGAASGTIQFAMSGEALTDMATNRTGFCVLHPLAECVGEACVIEHSDGRETHGRFPQDIAPHQPFRDIRAIRHRAGSAGVRVVMEGEVFEMEDQRNWSDGSFKTYCRPLELPKPYLLKKGDVVRQTITVTVEGAEAVKRYRPEPVPSLDVEHVSCRGRMPAVGIAAAEGIAALDARAFTSLRELGAQHLRLDIDLASATWRARLEQEAPFLAELSVPLEVAVHVRELGELTELAGVWAGLSLPVARWIVLPERGVTSARQAEAARTALGAISRAPLAGGTDVEFVAVNREHPPMAQLDMLSFSLNPQVHSFDELSLIENLESHRDMAASARNIAGARPVAISPITLRRRSNPDATAPEMQSAGALPASVDPRQRELFLAAWTVGALTRLCMADSLTFYETHGARGLMMGESKLQWPALFGAKPGEVFPVYHVLRSVMSFGAERWMALAVERPLELAGLLLQRSGSCRLLLANLTDARQVVQLVAPVGARVRLLHEANLSQARRDPDYWIELFASALPADGQIELGSYAVAQVDWSAS